MLRLLKARQRRQIQDWERVLEAKEKALKFSRQREADMRLKLKFLREEVLRLETEIFKERQERLNWQEAAEGLGKEQKSLEDELERLLRQTSGLG